MKHSFREIAGSSGWMSGYRLVRMGVAFGVGILVARYLGPEQYGQLSYSMALVLMLIGIAGPGMKDVITRKFDGRGESGKAAVLKASFRLMLFMNMGLLALALLVALLLRPDQPVIVAMTLIMGIGNVFRAFETYELLFLYRLQMSRTVMVQAASFFTISAGKLLLIAADADVVLFAAVIGFELVLTAAGFWLLFRRSPEGRVKPVPAESVAAGEILKESWPAIAGLAFTVMLFKADQIMLGWLSGDAEVGRYAIAAQFSEYWMYLATAVVVSFYPVLLEARRESKGSFEKRFMMLASLLIYGGALIAVPVWLLGEWIILFFMGDAFSGSAAILRIHIWSLFFVFMLEAMKKYYVIESILPAYIRVSAVAALVNIGLNFWLIPQYGGVGAAWATVFSYAGAGFWALFLFADTRRAGLLIIKSLAYPLVWLKKRTF
jgi:O-antigen/teichoic acid export membrane protein